MPTRRFFLRNSALAMAGAGASPLWLERALCATDGAAAGKKILVAIFQRGAAAGLNVVVPHGEKAYYDLRPTIAIPRPTSDPGRKDDAAIDLDGFFGLHPALAPLKPLFDQRHLAIVDAVGSPDPTRSHFDAQDYMESGTPGRKATGDGWMNRALPRAAGKPSPLRAVSLGPVLARSLRGNAPAVAMQTIEDFQVRDRAAAKQFERMYTASTDPLLQAAGRETFEAVAMLQAIQRRPYTPAAGEVFPAGKHTLTVTFTPASAATFNAAISVADNAAGSPQSAAISGIGSAGTYVVNASTPTQSIQPGAVAQFNLVIAPLGGSFNNVVTLSATGLPAGAQYSFLPPSVTPGSSGATSVLSIQTATGLSRLAAPAPHRQYPVPLYALLAGLPLLGLAATRRRFRGASRRWMLLGLAALAILPLLALSGCAGGYFGPTPQTFTVTVVGTSGALQESTTISLTVQ